jgi:hypothetical protein
MGVEPARVLEVHAGATVVAGYLLDDRLVLTAGAGQAPARVRPGGTATWLGASTAWSSPAGVCLLELDDPEAVLMAPEPPPWGRVVGRRPVAVTAMGFPPAPAPERRARDPVRFFGHAAASDSAALAVSGGPPGAGMTGAALFAGAELVGVLLAGAARAVPAGLLAADPGFARLVAGAGQVLALRDVSSPATAFPML